MIQMKCISFDLFAIFLHLILFFNLEDVNILLAEHQFWLYCYFLIKKSQNPKQNSKHVFSFHGPIIVLCHVSVAGVMDTNRGQLSCFG